MFDRLRLLVRRIISGTEEAFCLRCRAKRTITKSRRVQAGTKVRLVGTCLTCQAQTSTFIKAA